MASPPVKSQQQTMPKFTGKTVPLTAQQKAAWDMTRSSLLWNCPAFTHIFYTMMAHGGDIAMFTDEIPLAATDGKVVMLNPDTFFKLTLNERVFALAHEISHGMFLHCQTMFKLQRTGKVITRAGKALEYNQDLMNIAMDLVINDMLIESHVGRFNANWLHDKNFGKAEDSVIDVYEKVFKEVQKQAGKMPKGMSLDQHMQPGQATGKDPQQAVSDTNQVEWDMAIAAGMAAAKAQGKLPAAMERMLGAMLEPEVPWQEKIQAFFARKVGSGSFDWRKPDRRLIVRDIYAPGRSGFGAGEIVVAVDTSGSIGNVELDRFFAEMRGILDEVRPKKMHIVWCDAKVHKVDAIEEVEELRGVKPLGGGGTSFIPPFEWVQQEGLDPDAMVYLTDGDGPFPPRAPKYPVLWGNINPGKKYPWGEVVEVPIKEKK